jgi:hypothetical protein
MSRRVDRGGAAQASVADQNLEQLLQLTREVLTDETWPATEGQLRRLHDRVSAPRARVRGSAITALVLAATALPAAWLLFRRPLPLTFEVIHGTVGKSGEIRPVDTDTRIRFSEGSEVVLDEEARTQVRDLTADGGRIVLTQGRAHTFFVPKPHARWQVAAGPYVVQVTGTIFDVEWSEENQALDVWLRKGSVTVRGPMIGGGVTMTHGQHLLTRIRDNKIVLDNLTDADANAAAGPSAAALPSERPGRSGAAADPETGTEADEEIATDDQSADAPPSLSGAGPAAPGATANRRAGGLGGHPWSRHLARGDFEAVIAAAERRGIETVLERGSRRDLGALADAARYTRRGALARRVLRAERGRFPDSTEGREAAYFLGNLAEDEGTNHAAVTWFGRYLHDDPSGTYSSQALGRTMLIHAREPDGRARDDAQEYLRRFPTGSYAEAARRILKPR